jgi:hypothetical protein
MEEGKYAYGNNLEDSRVLGPRVCGSSENLLK